MPQGLVNDSNAARGNSSKSPRWRPSSVLRFSNFINTGGFLGCLLQIRAERGTMFMRYYAQQPHFRCLEAPGKSGDRASGVSAKVKAFSRLSSAVESALRRRMT